MLSFKLTKMSARLPLTLIVSSRRVDDFPGPPLPPLCYVQAGLAEKRKSMLGVSMNVVSAGLIASLNRVNRIVYLKGKTP